MLDFSEKIIKWQATNGRNHLPWQSHHDPYRIWVSEIMLQQTGVKTVLRFYANFLKEFPTIKSLAVASEDSVLQKWSGLGYYRRARYMLATARIIVKSKGEYFPQTLEGLMALPGIGRSTAGAILVFAYGKKYPILDGNVKRVLARYFCIQEPLLQSSVINKLWGISEKLVPDKGIRPYTQGLMDLGSTVCSRGKPKCSLCPLSDQCKALTNKKSLEIPTKSKAKLLPTRETIMLLLTNRNNILMQRRRKNGVWGGLLSFPEFEKKEKLYISLETQFGVDLKSIKFLSPLRHTFSHYKLVINLMKASTVLKPILSPANGTVWLPIEEISKAAIPAPVRKIIKMHLVGRSKSQ